MGAAAYALRFHDLESGGELARVPELDHAGKPFGRRRRSILQQPEVRAALGDEACGRVVVLVQPELWAAGVTRPGAVDVGDPIGEPRQAGPRGDVRPRRLRPKA